MSNELRPRFSPMDKAKNAFMENMMEEGFLNEETILDKINDKFVDKILDRFIAAIQAASPLPHGGSADLHPKLQEALNLWHSQQFDEATTIHLIADSFYQAGQRDLQVRLIEANGEGPAVRITDEPIQPWPLPSPQGETVK